MGAREFGFCTIAIRVADSTALNEELGDSRWMPIAEVSGLSTTEGLKAILVQAEALLGSA